MRQPYSIQYTIPHRMDNQVLIPDTDRESGGKIEGANRTRLRGAGDQDYQRRYQQRTRTYAGGMSTNARAEQDDVILDGNKLNNSSSRIQRVEEAILGDSTYMR